MAYLLDADVFIRAKNLHYGFDFFTIGCCEKPVLSLFVHSGYAISAFQHER